MLVSVAGVPALLKHLFKKDPLDASSRDLYWRIVEQARQPDFYRHVGVPDSLDGRFELVILHVFMVLRRLKLAGTETADLGQHLFDILFQDMDQCLREIGVGDTGVKVRIKRMVQGFYGRVQAYDTALPASAGELEAALRRNVYGTVDAEGGDVAAMAAYVRRESEALAAQEPADLLAGRVAFGAPPGAVGSGPGRGPESH